MLYYIITKQSGVLILMRCSEIIDKPIYENKTKEMLSMVYDVVLKKDSNEISGFVWKRKMLRKDFGIILYRDLQLLGKDGLYVKSNAVSHDFDYDNSLCFGLSYKHDFLNKIVLNKDCELIGIIRDIMLDKDLRCFQSFEFSEGYIDDLITGRKLIMAGDGYKIDSNAITILADSVIQEQGGGLINMDIFN